jgi:hypothetical protein
VSAMRGRDADVELAAFDALDRNECIIRWQKRFGASPPPHVSVRFMRRALAYEDQIERHGGHSASIKRALRRALKTERQGKARSGSNMLIATPLLRSGIQLVREWNGRPYRVEVLDDGFQMDGKRYRSLSAIAKKITGTHWSGPRFFGLIAS